MTTDMPPSFGSSSSGSPGGDTGRVDWLQVALVLTAFGFLYLFTGLYLVSSGQSQSETLTLGQVFGPIDVEDSSQPVEVTVWYFNLEQSWAFFEISVIEGESPQSEQGQERIVLGGEMYHESGYDDEGAWEESKNTTHARLVLDQPGRYWLRLNAEGGGNGFSGRKLPLTTRVTVEVRQMGGSDTLFNLATLLLASAAAGLLIGSASLFHTGINALRPPPRETSDPGRTRLFMIGTAGLAVVVWLLLLTPSANGYGYTGYGGHYGSGGGGFFLFGSRGDASTYAGHRASARRGSLRGSSSGYYGLGGGK